MSSSKSTAGPSLKAVVSYAFSLMCVLVVVLSVTHLPNVTRQRDSFDANRALLAAVMSEDTAEVWRCIRLGGDVNQQIRPERITETENSSKGNYKDYSFVRSFFDASHQSMHNSLYPEAEVSLLHLAVYKKNYTLLQTVLSAGGNPNKWSRDGDSPLMWAVRSGDTYMVDILLSYGADPNGINRTKSNPLFRALLTDSTSRPDIIHSLIRMGADPDAVISDNKTVTDYAKMLGKQDLLQASASK